MRKHISGLLVLILILALCGCSGGGSTPTTVSSAPAATARPTDVPASSEVVDPTSVGFPVPSEAPLGDSALADDGRIRVRLASLGSPSELHLTISGAYTVEGGASLRLQSGGSVALFLSDGQIWLTDGTLTAALGTSAAFVRHRSSEERPGIVIAETGRENRYVGDLRVEAVDGALQATLTADIEEYLLGVVAYEMGDAWPEEALKAQAVAARTYALRRKQASTGRAYDVVDTTADQVFRGTDDSLTHIAQAVMATAGVVGVAPNGSPAGCWYTASNGGQIARPSDVWEGGDDGTIEVRDDPYDLDNPRSMVNTASFTAEVSELPALRSMLQAALEADHPGAQLIRVTAAEAVDPRPADTRMYRTVRFTVDARLGAGSAASQAPTTQGGLFQVTPGPSEAPSSNTQTVAEERSLTVDLSVYGQLKSGLSLGMNNADCELCTVSEENGTFTISFRRFGHGVGMSQRGAQRMAGHYGLGWRQILGFYYPGMSLQTVHWQTPELTPLSAVGTSVQPVPTATPTPAPLPELGEGERYATVTLSDSGSSLNVRQEPSTQAAVVARLASGRRVIVSGEASAEGWIRVRTAEWEGYAMAQYLKAD